MVIGYFTVTSASFLKRVILPKASAALNVTITVQDASISPFSSITLSKLQVQTAGAVPLLRAESVLCRYSLWSILRGNIRVSKATLDTPVVQLVKNPDGTSNLDPFLKSSGGESNAAAGQPLRLELQQLAVKNGTLRCVEGLPSGGKQVAEITGLNLAADTIANDHEGKIRVATDLRFDQGLGSPTNGALGARLEGELDFALDTKLSPASVKGNLTLSVVEATGAFGEAAGVGATLQTDLAFPEIHTLALRFSKGPTPLGALVASGTFNPATLDSRLSLELSGIDRQLLNIPGATFGGDFNATTLTSTNFVELAQGAKAIALSGRSAVNKCSLTVEGRSTPTMDLNTTYNVTLDLPSRRALLNDLTIHATLGQNPLLHGALTKPMSLDWSGATSSPEESAFELVLTNLNLANWAAFAPDLAPAGRLNLALTVLAQQVGKNLKVDLGSQLADFSARIASNRLEAVNATVALHADLDEFTTLSIRSLDAMIARQKQPALNLGASGKLDLQAMDADLQTKLDLQLPPLGGLLGNPAFSVNSGTVELTGHLVQQNQSSGQTTNAAYNRAVVGSLRLDGLTGRLGACSFDDFTANVDCDMSVKDQLAEIKRLSASCKQAGHPGGSLEVTGTLDLGKTNGQVAFHLVDLNQSVVRSLDVPLPGGSKIESVSLSLDAFANFDAQAGSAVKGEFRMENLNLASPQIQRPATPIGLLLKLDGGLKGEVAELNQCAGSFHQGRLSGGSFDVTGQFNLKTRAGRAALRLHDLNQNILQPLLASALGNKTLGSASINISADASYDPKAKSAVKGELQMLNLLLSDPQGLVSKTPLTAAVKLDGSVRDNLAEIRQFVGYVKQGDLPGGSFDIKGDYHLARHGGQLEVRLTDLNQNALGPLLSGALGDKKLESVSINLSSSAHCEARGESTLNGELQVANLLMRDSSGASPTVPLKFALQFDGSLARKVLELQKLQLVLTETARAKQQLQLTGTLDFAGSNGVAGDLKLAAESLDFTPCFDLLTSQPHVANQTERAQPQAIPPASRAEPDLIRLPAARLTLDAAIGRLCLHEIEVANFAATCRIETNTVTIDPFSLTLNDAPVSLRAFANLGVPGFEYDFNLNGNGVPLEPIMNSFDSGQRGQFGGSLSVTTAIKGAGVTGASLQKHLAGNASLTLTNASIQLAGTRPGDQDRGSALTAFLSAVLKPVGVLLRVPDMTKSPLDFVDAHADVSAGTIKLRSLLLQSSVFQATTAGTVSLADPVSASRLNDLPVGIALERNTLVRAGLASANAATATPYTKLPDFCKVSGTLADPKVKTDALALSRGLLPTGSQALQGLAGAGAAGALGSLGGALPGAGPAAAGAAVAPSALPATTVPALPRGPSWSSPLVPTASTLTNAVPKTPSPLDLLKSGK